MKDRPEKDAHTALSLYHDRTFVYGDIGSAIFKTDDVLLGGAAFGVGQGGRRRRSLKCKECTDSEERVDAHSCSLYTSLFYFKFASCHGDKDPELSKFRTSRSRVWTASEPSRGGNLN